MYMAPTQNLDLWIEDSYLTETAIEERINAIKSVINIADKKELKYLKEELMYLENTLR